MRARERIRKVLEIVEEEAGASGVRLDGDSAVLEFRKVLLDLLVQILPLTADFDRSNGDFAPRICRTIEGALGIARLGGGNLVAGRGDEVDARVVERDRRVAFVGDDDADGDDVGGGVVDAKDRGLLRGVVGVDGDGEMVVGVALKGRVLIGGSGRRRGMLRAEVER